MITCTEFLIKYGFSMIGFKIIVKPTKFFFFEKRVKPTKLGDEMHKQ